MKKSKIITAAALAALLAIPAIAYTATTYTKNINVTYGLKVTLNGEPIEWIDSNGKQVDAFAYEDTAYVPLKTLAPLFGSSTEYHYETNTVDIIGNARWDAFVLGYTMAVYGQELPEEAEQDLIAKGIPLAYTPSLSNSTQLQPNDSYAPQQYDYYSDSASNDPLVEKAVDEYLTSNDEYNKMYEEYIDMGLAGLEAINNGTMANAEDWIANYEAMGELLNSYGEGNSELLQTILGMVEANSKIHSDSSPSTSDYDFPLHLYSNDGKVYLGKCVTDGYDRDSIWYSLELAGNYSSNYGSNSIWNEYGTYGGAYSNESAFNDRATKPPMIVDNDGAFVAYLTTNDTIDNGWTIAELRQFVENNNQ